MARFGVDEENRSKQPAWVCREDIKARNDKYRGLFTAAHEKLALAVHSGASSAWPRTVYPPKYNEKFITIKVEAPKTYDRAATAIRDFEVWCAKQGVKVKDIYNSQTGKLKSVVYHVVR